MKIILLLSFFLLYNYSNIFAQENNFKDSINFTEFPKNELYILDSIKKHRDLRIFKMHDQECYLQINDGYVIFTYQARENSLFASGKIYRSGIHIVEGDSVNTFTFITDNKFAGRPAGRRVFLGITKNAGTKQIVYILDNAKLPEYKIKAHIASAEEKERFIKQRQK